jgi:hypothetical protein
VRRPGVRTTLTAGITRQCLSFEHLALADDRDPHITTEFLESAATVPIYLAACVRYRLYGTRVILVHHPFTVRGPPGLESPLEGRRFALTGDVLEGQMPTLIEWPHDLLVEVEWPEPVGEDEGVEIIAPGSLLEYFNDHPQDQWMPEELPQENRVLVRVRKGCFVPAPLVPSLIGEPLAPRAALACVATEATRLGLVNAIRPLLNWLAVCCRRPPPDSDWEGEVIDGPRPGPVTSVDHMQYPLNAELLGIVRQRVHSELPGLVSQGGAPTAATMGNNDFLGHAVLQLAGNVAAAQTRTTTGTAAATTPAEFYGVNLKGLLRMPRGCRRCFGTWRPVQKANSSLQSTTISELQHCACGWPHRS